MSFRSQRTRDNLMCMESGQNTSPAPPSLLRPKMPPAKWAYSRWLLLRSIPVALVLLLIGAGWQFVLMGRARPLEGVYLMPDGISYVVLKPGFWPALQVSQGYIHSGTLSTDPYSISFSASLRRSQMVLKQVQVLGIPSTRRDRASIKNTLILGLVPSQRVPGDWDLISASVKEKGRASDLGSFPFGMPSSSSWEDIKETVVDNVNSLRTEVIVSGDLDPANAPIPSFLHRAADARVADLCLKEVKRIASGRDLKLLREMTKEDPLDICLALHRVAMEIRMGNLEEAENVLERWNAAYAASAHPHLRSTALRARRVLDTRKWRQEHGDLVAMWERIGSTDSLPATPSLPELLQWLQDVLKTASLYPAVEEMVSREPSWRLRSQNFLAIQIFSKVGRVQSTFCLLQGEKGRSLELLAGTYWMGQSFNAADLLISKLIGVAVRSISTGGLELHAFEGCRNPEELREVWNTLERLVSLPGQETGETLLNGEYPPLLTQMQRSGEFESNMKEALTRQGVTDARFAALRTAIAAQYRRMTAGEFPKTPAEFGPLLPGGPLGDCFATSVPLKFLEKPDGFYVYSIGPDGQDDALTISYDPTNGTMSRGDISIRVPRKREYPFPAEGVRVNTAAELLKMFPNGLPPDLFADTKGRPLSIFAASRADWEACAVPGAKKIWAGGAPGAEDPNSSPTLPRTADNATTPTLPRAADNPTTLTPVAVFSFGPDTDESEYSDYQYLAGQDVFTTYSLPMTPYQLVFPLQGIPQRTRQTPPPMPPYVDSLLRGKTVTIPPGSIGFDSGLQERSTNLTGIHRGYGQASSGEYLQPPYDPTNGITSKGNLYLIFPRP